MSNAIAIGTVTASAAGSITDANAVYTLNSFIGYDLYLPDVNKHFVITSNDATTLFFADTYIAEVGIDFRIVLSSDTQQTILNRQSGWKLITSSTNINTRDVALVDTTNGVITLTMTSSPAFGDSFFIFDGSTAGSWGTNNVIINPNGNTILGSATNYMLTHSNGWAEFIYDGTTWQVRQSQVIPTVPVTSVAGKTGAVTLTTADVTGAENTANKDAPNGYAGLDANGELTKLPAGAAAAPAGAVLRQDGSWVFITFVNVLDYLTTTEKADVLARTALVDVTTSVQNAINAVSATGGTLYFPAGIYRVSGVATAGAALSVNAQYSGETYDGQKPLRVNITGDGAGSSIIKNVSTDPTVYAIRLYGDATGSTQSHSYETFEHIGIDCSATGARGLLIHSKAYYRVKDIHINNANIGLHLVSTLSSSFSNMTINWGGTGIMFDRTYSATGSAGAAVGFSNCNSNTFSDCMIAQNSAFAMNMGTSANNAVAELAIIGCDVSANGTMGSATGGVRLVTSEIEGAVAANIQNCYFEINKGDFDLAFINIGTTVSDLRAVVQGCLFLRDSASLYTTRNLQAQGTDANNTIEVLCIGNAFQSMGSYAANSARPFTTEFAFSTIWDYHNSFDNDAGLTNSTYTATNNTATAASRDIYLIDYIPTAYHAEIAAKNLASVYDATTDFNTAYAAAVAAGVNLILPAGLLQFSSTLTITDDGVNIIGQGGGWQTDQTTGNDMREQAGTILKRLGTSATSIISFERAATSLNNIASSGLFGVLIDGENYNAGTPVETATVGLQVLSAFGCKFEDVAFQHCTTHDIYMGVIPTASGDPRDSQFNRFSRIVCRELNSCNPIYLHGDALANSSFNTFDTVEIVHRNGTAFKFGSSDTNLVNQLLLFRNAGTAVGIEFMGGTTTDYARDNNVAWADPGAGGVVARAGTVSSTNNTILYSPGNGAPIPTVETGATLMYQSDSGVFGGNRIFNDTVNIAVIQEAGVPLTTKYSLAGHTHTQYALTSHTHTLSSLSGAVTNSQLPTLISQPNISGSTISAGNFSAYSSVINVWETIAGFLRVGPTQWVTANGDINCNRIYAAGAPICYVLEAVNDGDIDEQAWDDRIPNNTYTEDDGSEREEVTLNEGARKFKARLGTEYDPLDMDKYEKHWRDKGHLTSMPSKEAYDNGTLDPISTYGWIQRLVETVEIQAVHIANLNARLKALESK